MTTRRFTAKERIIITVPSIVNIDDTTPSIKLRENVYPTLLRDYLPRRGEQTPPDDGGGGGGGSFTAPAPTPFGFTYNRELFYGGFRSQIAYYHLLTGTSSNASAGVQMRQIQQDPDGNFTTPRDNREYRPSLVAGLLTPTFTYIGLRFASYDEWEDWKNNFNNPPPPPEPHPTTTIRVRDLWGNSAESRWSEWTQFLVEFPAWNNLG